MHSPFGGSRVGLPFYSGWNSSGDGLVSCLPLVAARAATTLLQKKSLRTSCVLSCAAENRFCASRHNSRHERCISLQLGENLIPDHRSPVRVYFSRTSILLGIRDQHRSIGLSADARMADGILKLHDNEAFRG